VVTYTNNTQEVDLTRNNQSPNNNLHNISMLKGT